MSDEQLAKEANIPVAVLKSIREIESSGNPAVVRFEPHVFLRITGGGKRENSPWKEEIPFTRDPVRKISLVKAETDRAAFEHAAKLDRNAAISSTSFGLYQVMGTHLLKLFKTSDPVAEFDKDPRLVSDKLLVMWFKANPKAAKAARNFDIMDLAKRYNGSERWGLRVSKALEKYRG